MEKCPYSPFLHIFCQFLVFTTLILPPSFPSSLRRLFFIPIAAITYHLAFRSSTGDVFTDFGVASGIISQGVVALDFVLLHDPRFELRQKKRRELAKGKDKGEQGDTLDGGPGKTLMERVAWAFSLLVNPRGYGWSNEPAPGILPPRPPANLTRPRFLINQLLKLLFLVSLEVAAYVLNDYNPTMRRNSVIWHSSWPLRAIAVLGACAAGYARINMCYCLSAIITVALGLSEPQGWPNLYGNIWDAWSVGMFWSRVWHQMLRRPLCSITNWILPPMKGQRNMVYDFLRLFVVFFVSGIIHGAGGYMTLDAFDFNFVLFFILQPPIIVLEKFALPLLFSDPKNPNTFERLFGIGFVLGWFTLTAPLFVDSMIRVGLFEDEKGTLGYLVVNYLLPRVGIELGRS
ncbi:hypothetical protein Agabi119p4_11527 [Agaricus bisporus var. burnettii]|uniref:Wax synthase domain-containing protein n=1 Tax=Agaricus bisporus var. burnettii TaxID=192524 RepID=A0A8H7BZ25_AGABI|nr:hypothetical protein Agabi119p4_11527 [Agaricus bisporus var. burnettii]